MKLNRKHVILALQLLLGLIALFFLTDFGRSSLEASLDRSWVAVVGWAFDKKLQFGRDIIFTYGPLGYLLYPINLPILFWRALLLKTGLHALLIVMVFVLSRELNPVRRGALFLTTLIVASYHPLITQVFMIVMACFIVFCRPGTILKIACVLFLSMTFLMKGTDLLLVSPLLMGGAAYLIWQRETRAVVLIFCGFAVAIPVIWALTGQQPGNIPAYIISILEVAQGYGEGMSIRPKPAILAAGLIGFGLLSAQIILAWVRHRMEPRAWFVSAMLGLTLFMVWKMSFTRADVHTTQLFFYGIPVVIAFPMFFNGQRSVIPPTIDYLVILGVLASGFFLIHDITRYTFGSIWSHSQARITSNLSFITAPARELANAEAAYQNEVQKLALPEIRNAIGGATVDVFGWEQAVAIANDLNYTPRPVFQGYCAQTTRLIKTNGDFYRSASAPEYVIFKLQALEGHLPTLDDAEALLVLTQDYEPVLVENGYTLLRRKSSAPTTTEFKLIGSGKVRVGEPIPVPNGVIWCKLHIRKKFSGRLMSFLYQLPEIHAVLARSDKLRLNHRIIPAPAANGFLINPQLEHDTDFGKLAHGNYPAAEIQSLTLRPPKYAKAMVQLRVGYEFFEISPVRK